MTCHHTGNLKTKGPKKHHLQSWLSSIAVEWKELGTSLKVDSGTLASYTRTQISDVNKLMDVLNNWRTSQCSPFTFEQLITSLCDINKFDVADLVIKKLDTEDVLHEYKT